MEYSNILLVLQDAMTSPWWQTLLWCVLALIIGAVAGFFIARVVFKKQLEKHPPIDEKMIRAMFLQMGRKPSEAQIRSVMNNMTKKK